MQHRKLLKTLCGVQLLTASTSFFHRKSFWHPIPMAWSDIASVPSMKLLFHNYKLLNWVKIRVIKLKFLALGLLINYLGHLSNLQPTWIPKQLISHQPNHAHSAQNSLENPVLRRVLTQPPFKSVRLRTVIPISYDICTTSATETSDSPSPPGGKAFGWYLCSDDSVWLTFSFGRQL